LIVVFGEIVPQAAFSRYALVLGSKLVWLVRIFLIILFPICWPLAWILDKVLGDELDTVYSKRELIKMIEKHEDLSESEIDEDEERIIKGGLSYSEKAAQDIMTPRVEMVALKKEQRLDKKTLAKVVATGHSRIPIYKERMDNIVGILYVKDLIGVDLKNKTAGSIARKNVIFVDSNAFLDDLLEDFKRTRNHLFVVIDKYNSVVGVVTIEDVIEEIIGAEIVDEFDNRVDLQEQAKKKAKKRTKKS
jgi:metal transporter CNNM